MFKNKGYFIETVVYQVIWIIASSVISMIIYEGLDTIVYKNISGNQFNGLYSAYFSFGRYGIIVMLLLIIICGTFYIQKKRFDKYNQYIESGLMYLTQECNELLEFHESLSAERDVFIELRNYNKELEEKYEKEYQEKTDLLTYLAHDIKTPIANMMGYIVLLNEEKDISEQNRTKFINIIYENVKYLNQLTEEFFSYLKFSLNDIPVNLTTFNIGIFFRQWEDEKRIITKNHKLKLKVAEKDFIDVQMDAQLLLRILDNLTTNAINYSSDDSEIEVNVEIAKDILNIGIINTIKSDVIINWDMVKTKFYRGDLSRRRGESGSGLGLTIVNEIVNHLGGNFEINESDGKVFANVMLPCKK
jgi:two-component sensor histidine kinase